MGKRLNVGAYPPDLSAPMLSSMGNWIGRGGAKMAQTAQRAYFLNYTSVFHAARSMSEGAILPSAPPMGKQAPRLRIWYAPARLWGRGPASLLDGGAGGGIPASFDAFPDFWAMRAKCNCETAKPRPPTDIYARSSARAFLAKRRYSTIRYNELRRARIQNGRRRRLRPLR